jgi:hypothetical protein
MQIIIMDQGATIDIMFYTKQFLEGEVMSERQLPGTKSTFIEQQDLPMLLEQERTAFYSKVAKLQFLLAKRPKLDILTVVSFLCMQGCRRSLKKMKVS